MNKMKPQDIIKNIREYSGKTQHQIAEILNIKYQTIQRYEKKGSIPANILRELCGILNIDPEYILGKSEYPFKSGDLIKMFVSENIFKFTLDPLYFVASFNKNIYVIYLTSYERSEFTNIDHKVTLPKVYAIAFKDDHNNYFLLRRRKVNKTINPNEIFPTTINKIISMKCKFHIESKEIGNSSVYEKIKNWDDVKRDDIEKLFKEAKFESIFNLSEELKEQLRQQEILGIDYISKYKLIMMKDIDDLGFSPEEVSSILNKERKKWRS